MKTKSLRDLTRKELDQIAADISKDIELEFGGFTETVEMPFYFEWDQAHE